LGSRKCNWPISEGARDEPRATLLKKHDVNKTPRIHRSGSEYRRGSYPKMFLRLDEERRCSDKWEGGSACLKDGRRGAVPPEESLQRCALDAWYRRRGKKVGVEGEKPSCREQSHQSPWGESKANLVPLVRTAKNTNDRGEGLWRQQVIVSTTPSS